jgi:hypothetical protein
VLAELVPSADGDGAGLIISGASGERQLLLMGGDSHKSLQFGSISQLPMMSFSVGNYSGVGVTAGTEPFHLTVIDRYDGRARVSAPVWRSEYVGGQ